MQAHRVRGYGCTSKATTSPRGVSADVFAALGLSEVVERLADRDAAEHDGDHSDHCDG